MAYSKNPAGIFWGPAALLLLSLHPVYGAQDEEALRPRALWALRHAVVFFRTQVSTEGGYLWRYSEDLQRREGEGIAGNDVVWVQPPGTPAVGMAFLNAYEATGEKLYLDAARDAAQALVRGQLHSGGWTHHIDFDPEKRKRFAYRLDPQQEKQRNWSSLDDNTTQSALRLLMRVDKALEFKDQTIHEAARFGLDALLSAQHPNGAFSQGFDGPVEGNRPPRKASYPETWPRSIPRGNDYWYFYTFNDNLIEDVVAALLDAEKVYGEKRFRDAAEKAGDFIILARMPPPQPAWAQQYDFDMHPAWARKFEPPAVTGGESQGVMRTLLTLYRVTGRRKYLEPIPKALTYFRKSALPDGRLARFYELRTNRPLYFTRDYQLTYSDKSMPTHYSFKVDSGLDKIEREYERLRNMTPQQLAHENEAQPPVLSRELVERARRIVGELDERGRWVTEGGLQFDKKYKGRVIDCRTFIHNVETLSLFLAASKR